MSQLHRSHQARATWRGRCARHRVGPHCPRKDGRLQLKRLHQFAPPRRVRQRETAGLTEGSNPQFWLTVALDDGGRRTHESQREWGLVLNWPGTGEVGAQISGDDLIDCDASACEIGNVPTEHRHGGVFSVDEHHHVLTIAVDLALIDFPAARLEALIQCCHLLSPFHHADPAACLRRPEGRPRIDPRVRRRPGAVGWPFRCAAPCVSHARWSRRCSWC